MNTQMLYITFNSNNEVIVSFKNKQLNFGSITTGGYEGIEIKTDVFEKLNNYYSKPFSTYDDVLESIFNQYEEIYNLLSHGVNGKEAIQDLLGDMVTTLINQHHYSNTTENIFDSEYLDLVNGIYECEEHEIGMSLNDYLSLAETSLVLKILIPIHSMCDGMFEEEEDFASIEKIMFDSLNKSLFGNGCILIHFRNIEIYEQNILL